MCARPPPRALISRAGCASARAWHYALIYKEERERDRGSVAIALLFEVLAEERSGVMVPDDVTGVELGISRMAL